MSTDGPALWGTTIKPDFFTSLLKDLWAEIRSADSKFSNYLEYFFF